MINLYLEQFARELPVGVYAVLYQIQFEFAVTRDPEPRASARAKLEIPFTPATAIGILQLELVLLWDQAGFHTANALRIPENVSIIELPPNSPELNPMESLWHYLRSHYWSNRIYEDYEALLDAATKAWQEARLDHALVKTVCAAPYLKERT